VTEEALTHWGTVVPKEEALVHWGTVVPKPNIARKLAGDFMELWTM